MKVMSRSSLIKVLLLAAVVGAAVLWKASKVTAFNPQPDPPGFGLVAFDPNQTMRFNVSCPNVNVGGAPPGPCRGTLNFFDTRGGSLKQADYSLNPGESFSLDLTAKEVGFEGNRAEIQPSISPAAGRAVPSVEVFNANTGKTDIFVHPAAARLRAFVNYTSTSSGE